MAPTADSESLGSGRNMKKYFQDNSRTKDFVGHSAKVNRRRSILINMSCLMLPVFNLLTRK